MYKLILLLSTVFLVIIMLACDSGTNSPRGFSLPEGDAVKGEKVFMNFKCLSCHNLEGFDDDSANREMEPSIRLGGPTTRVKTYADLVTSVINPSHKLARHYMLQTTQADGTSKMPAFNDVMTVTELVDLVTFLQEKYAVQPYEYTHYGHYQFH
ncbi:MAG: sulfur-oxidizing protein SoxX [Paraglaciecola sp.]|jgi:sulfur-oxidizing protein SoxX